MRACSRPLGGWTRTMKPTKMSSCLTLPGRKTSKGANLGQRHLLSVNLPQLGPCCNRPPVRGTRGLCRRGHGLRRGPWVKNQTITEHVYCILIQCKEEIKHCCPHSTGASPPSRRTSRPLSWRPPTTSHRTSASFTSSSRSLLLLKIIQYWWYCC